MVARRITGALNAAHRAWLRHPRWSLATRGAIAAGIAWYVGLIAPAPLSEYPYYAPLGAVIATTSTLVRSVRDSAQVTLAVLVGAGIARAADAFLAPGAPAVAVVVGAALLISGWRYFGEMGNWVATSAIFVLILGNADALEYVGSFAGLVAAGAAIGIGVNLALPPLPLTPTEDALDRLSNVLADQAEDLAGEVAEAETLPVDEWNRRRQTMDRVLEQGRRSARRTREAERANPRVRRHREWTRRQQVRVKELETVAASLDQAISLLMDTGDPVDLGDPLRRSFADVLRALVKLLRAHAWDPDRQELADRFDEVARSFTGQARQEGPQNDAELVAGALAVALQRAADAFRR